MSAGTHRRGRRIAASIGRALQVSSLGALALVAFAHVALLCRIFAGRAAYPLDLEWMEGGMLCHALRVLEGKPIYAEPSVEFISYLYTPGYAVAVAGLGRVFGVSYLLGRLVSIFGFAVACAVAARVVYREARPRVLTGSSTGQPILAVCAALAAVGFICSSFPLTGAWYDLVRNDSLYLGLVTSALYLLRYHHRSPWRVALAGVLLGVAFLTKQTASVFILFSGAAMLLINWRRLFILVPVVGLIAGGGVLIGNVLSDGWMWRYIFEMHQNHIFFWDRIWPETELMLIRAFPIVGGAIGLWLVVFVSSWLWRVAKGRGRATWALDRRDRRLLYWFALFIVGVAVSAIGFATQWAVANAFIPAYYFASLFVGLVVADLVGWLLRRRHALLAGLMTLAVGITLSVQLGRQLYDPAPYLPTARSWGASRHLITLLSAIKGPILVPYHPFYAYLSHKATSYHQMGINDVMRAGYKLPKGIRERIEKKYYAALLFDVSPYARSDYHFILKYYKLGRYLRGEASPEVVAGYKVQPRYLLVPKRDDGTLQHGAHRVFGFEEPRALARFRIEGRAFGLIGGPNSSSQALAGPYEGYFLLASSPYGDAAKGTATSPSFLVDRSKLSYRLGGGRDPRNLVLELLDHKGKVVHRATGSGNHILQRHTVDVRAYRGTMLRLRLTDRSSGGWGHLLFDDLVLHD